MKGWISLHRRLQEHWTWKDKPFSKGQAWIDLLLMVNHEDKKVPLGKEIITVKRGSRITSIRKLCERWGWSNTKVVRFLEQLKNDKMITYFSDTKKTVLTIDKYDDYQNEEIEKRHRNVTETSPKHTNNNDNNENKYIVIFDYWNSKQITVHKALTKDMEKAINKAIKLYTIDQIQIAIDRYHKVYTDKNFYYCHKWVLEKFLKQDNGIKDWLDEGQRWVEYQERTNKPKSNNQIPHSDAKIV